MPRKEHYHHALDTVEFGPDVPPDVREARAASAAGVVMLDMLIGGATVLLSQAQAIDNAWLLGQLAETDDDGRALLRLARQGRLQVGVLDPSSPTDGGQELSLRHAFRAALANPDFVLVAWPELAEPARRRTVLELLDRDPSEWDSLGDGGLVARLHALAEFDASLRAGGAIRSVRPGDGPAKLRELVTRGLRELSEVDSASAPWVTRLLGMAQHEQGRAASRSGWYRMLDELRPEPEVDAHIRGVVNGAYNTVVAESLGATGTVTRTSSEVAPALASIGLHGEAGSQFVKLAVDPRRHEWLTWSRVADLLPDFDWMTSPRRRLASLVSEHQDFLRETATDRRAGLALQVALPTVAIGALGGLTGGLFSLVAGNSAASIAGGAAVGGSISLLAELPTVRRLRDRWGSHVVRREAERWEATVTTGTAGWWGEAA